MTDAIAPALTAAEWADPWWLLDDADALGEGQLWWGGGCFNVGYDSGYVSQDIDATPVQIMAVANAVLPPDSPYKLAPRHIAALTNVVQGYRDPDDLLMLDELASILAALLPPDSSLPGNT